MSTTKKSNYNENIKEYMLKYQKSHIQQMKFNFHKDNDADILAFLDALPNKQGYMKALIRADMARAKSESTKPAQNILKEDKTMTYNPVTEPSNLFFDHDPARVTIRGDQPAQNPDDPGVPAGGNPWYAVVQNPDDNWSNGSFDLREAVRIAQNLEGAKILVIDTSLDHPFITDELDPRAKYHIMPEHLSEWGDQTTEETVVSYAEVVNLAREWDVTVDELLDQLEEI